MSKKKRPPYNERLFKPKSIRRFLHLARYKWINYQLKKHQIKYQKVIELGCHDGRVLNYLPKKPLIYKGFDANWENGLDLAKKKFIENKNYYFYEAQNPNDMQLEKNEIFDLAFSLETLEHIPEQLLCPYLEKISQHLNGYYLITVPNEKGPFFIIKRLVRPKDDSYKYTFKDYINLLFGKTNSVERKDHKGFNYDHLIYDLKKYFDIIEVEGHPLGSFLPKFLCFGIGIIAKTKM